MWGVAAYSAPLRAEHRAEHWLSSGVSSQVDDWRNLSRASLPPILSRARARTARVGVLVAHHVVERIDVQQRSVPLALPVLVQRLYEGRRIASVSRCLSRRLGERARCEGRAIELVFGVAA